MNRETHVGGESVDPALAPVLGMLIRLLGTACLAAAAAIIVQGGIWALLAWTDVRNAGLESVVAPESAANAPIVTVHSVAAAPGAVPAATDATADLVLSSATAGSIVIGGIGLLVLPAILLVSFLVAVLRSPRSAAPCLGGMVWSLVILAAALPWSGLWPGIGWGGLFRGYGDLVASAAEGPALGSVLAHAILPLAATAMLVLISWRAGNALHADLLAAEALSVSPETRRESEAVAARGVSGTTARRSRGLEAMERTMRAESGRGSEGNDDGRMPSRLV